MRNRQAYTRRLLWIVSLFRHDCPFTLFPSKFRYVVRQFVFSFPASFQLTVQWLAPDLLPRKSSQHPRGWWLDPHEALQFACLGLSSGLQRWACNNTDPNIAMDEPWIEGDAAVVKSFDVLVPYPRKSLRWVRLIEPMERRLHQCVLDTLTTVYTFSARWCNGRSRNLRCPTHKS